MCLSSCINMLCYDIATGEAQVFNSQYAVMDMSEKDAEYFLSTLSPEGAENRSREEILRETERIFEKQEFSS